MATEVKLAPGWLIKDVQRASERLDCWSSHTRSSESSGPYAQESTAKGESNARPNGEKLTERS